MEQEPAAAIRNHGWPTLRADDCGTPGVYKQSAGRPTLWKCGDEHAVLKANTDN